MYVSFLKIKLLKNTKNTIFFLIFLFFPNCFAVHVSPGSLPKGLHTLNLSRNKITAIEGLRELTRLRVLDLSYNRISRFGQG